MVIAPDEGNTYILIGVFHHDDAYKWCADNRIRVNETQGAVEVEDVAGLAAAMTDAPSGSAASDLAATSAFFAARTDKDFLRLGIEQRFLSLIHDVRDESDALTLAEILPSSQGAALAMLAAGYSC